MMTILVTGANGQLGNEMRIVAQEMEDNYIFTDVSQIEGVDTVVLDITDETAIRKMVEEKQIDAIVNCAAYTNVDAAETNQDTAELLNATAPLYLAKAMKETGGLLIQISTDYVFGKEPYNTPCKEDPLSARTQQPLWHLRIHTGGFGLQLQPHGQQPDDLAAGGGGLPHRQGIHCLRTPEGGRFNRNRGSLRLYALCSG